MAVGSRLVEVFLFLAMVLFMQISCIFVFFASIITPRGFISFWQVSFITMDLFGIKVYHKKGEIYKEKCLYFMNHSGWSDFFMDFYATFPAKCVSALGRMAVYWAFPFGGGLLYLYNMVVFFRRGGSKQEDLNIQLEHYFDSVEHGHLIVYPEGTRNPDGEKMKLKTGMMRFAYRRQLPVQIIHVSNKGKILREKGGPSAHYGVKCELIYGDVIFPKDCTEDEFIKKIESSWESAALELQEPGKSTFLEYRTESYPIHIAIISAIGIAISLATYFWTKICLTIGALWVIGFGIAIYRSSFPSHKTIKNK